MRLRGAWSQSKLKFKVECFNHSWMCKPLKSYRNVHVACKWACRSATSKWISIQGITEAGISLQFHALTPSHNLTDIWLYPLLVTAQHGPRRHTPFPLLHTHPLPRERVTELLLRNGSGISANLVVVARQRFYMLQNRSLPRPLELVSSLSISTIVILCLLSETHSLSVFSLHGYLHAICIILLALLWKQN